MKNSVTKRKKVRLRHDTWVHKQRSGLGACAVTAEQHVAFESHAPWKLSNKWHEAAWWTKSMLRNSWLSWATSDVSMRIRRTCWATRGGTSSEACAATCDWAEQQRIKQLGGLRACSATADWAEQQVASVGACAVTAEQHVAQVTWHAPRHVTELINKCLKQACSATADWAEQQVAPAGACAVTAEHHVAKARWWI